MRPDETVYTLTQRFDALGVASTEKRRRGLEQELAPIVVSETRMDGSRSIGHCDEVTSTLLQSVLNAVPSKESLWRSCWGLLTDGHDARANALEITRTNWKDTIRWRRRIA